MAHESRSLPDLVVVGAGLAGTAAAFAAGRAGHRTLLVDPRRVHAPCFKAEKVEPDQAAALRRLGLFDVVEPALTPIRQVLCARDGKLFGLEELEQYGVAYADLVNRLRERLPPTVAFREDRVVGLEHDAEGPRVRFASGDEVRCRLAVVATGVTHGLARLLGLERVMVDREHSMAFGFDVETDRPQEALTYYPKKRLSSIACLTLFPIGETTRANLFVYHRARSEWVRDFLDHPIETLEHDLPGLDAVTGGVRIRGRIESASIALYRTDPPARDGVVLLGDTIQSACPATGTGLTRVLSDVESLLHCLDGWKKAPYLSREALRAYYEHPPKRECDRHCLDAAIYAKNVATVPTLRWRLSAMRIYWRRRLQQRARLRRYLRDGRRAAAAAAARPAAEVARDRS